MRRISITLLVLLAWPRCAPADTIETLGSVGAIAVPASGLLVAAVHKDGRGTLQLSEAYAATMAVVYILKPIVNRERPDGGGQSFPSGHTASAFAGAAFLQRRYGWSCGLPAYAVATFVGYSRVEANRHWTSDVVAGAAIGIASNLVLTRRWEKVAVYPTLQARGAGIAIEVRW
jgi:membrane-associated phospholipid phosphatase